MRLVVGAAAVGESILILTCISDWKTDVVFCCPQLPSVASMTSAASTFTVVASIGDSKIVYDRAASLPPRLCACEGWKPPDVSETNGDEDDDVEVVISVLAENPGGASADATATLNATRATLKARRAASETKCEGAEDIEEPPPTPPRAVTAELIDGVDGGVLVDWYVSFYFRHHGD